MLSFIFRYLKILLQDMYTGVLSRQELTKKSRSEQERKRKDHEMKIDQLKKKCREVYNMVNDSINTTTTNNTDDSKTICLLLRVCCIII